MTGKAKTHLRIWEGALLIALCFTLCQGLYARAQQKSLSRQLVRLHIVASSDAQADQQLKLRVRDQVLYHLTPRLEDADTARDAYELIQAYLPELEKIAAATARESGVDYLATASLGTERYPTRSYGIFSLPPGEYVSLKICLGKSEGQNWWCVVFPPLCTAASQQAPAFSKLSEQARDMVLCRDDEYVLKLRILELMDSLSRELS